MKKKVVVGLSGGVDSAVAALLLKEQGYDVTGVTMRIWQEDHCLTNRLGGQTIETVGQSAEEDARRVAEALDIPYDIIDYRQEFKARVVDYFINEYLCARTPNPCVICNRYVKWEALLEYCRSIDADHIATGHYARIVKLPDGRLTLCYSVTAAKDQTYALFYLTQQQLAHTMMPVGEYSKEEIRALATRLGLPVADKPDSQEICFIPDNDYTGFIKRNSRQEVPPPGNFITADGTILGQHQGITHYTIGQRKGLGLSLGHPVFVSQIRRATNEVVVGEEAAVFTDGLRCQQLNFMGMASLPVPRRVTAKIRYAHKGAAAVIEQTGPDEVVCRFEEPVRAVTPGQAVVFYDGEYILGGGIIKEGCKC
ncbi:MAG: tRNA 2-thiouridine(34) synthase MnmA [Lachnospiraceae bacterium]|jgi:tRNA-specific 2-thiouridylase|nr:tRNA 2-thiouridine(34) synthase MnmA [Lachnospiraceae bacterium]